MNENFLIGYACPNNQLVSLLEEISELRSLNQQENFTTKSSMQTEKITSQAAAEIAIKGNYYIVGSVDTTGTVSFAANPAVHLNAAHARAECKRLALRTPDKTFVYVQLRGAERTVSQPTSVSI